MAVSSIDSKAENVSENIGLLDQWEANGVTIDKKTKIQVISTHYLVVAAYGIIESEMKSMLRLYIQNNTTQRTDEELERLTRVVNHCYQWPFRTIVKILEEFNNQWGADARSKVNLQQQNSISSLKAQRNRIAHGTPSYNTNFDEAKEQFEKSIDALKIISTIIN